MIYHNNIFVYDDIVDLDTQNKIKDLMLNKALWSFVSDVTNPQLNEQQRPGFAHWFIKDEIIWIKKIDKMGIKRKFKNYIK